MDAGKTQPGMCVLIPTCKSAQLPRISFETLSMAHIDIQGNVVCGSTGIHKWNRWKHLHVSSSLFMLGVKVFQGRSVQRPVVIVPLEEQVGAGKGGQAVFSLCRYFVCSFEHYGAFENVCLSFHMQRKVALLILPLEPFGCANIICNYWSNACSLFWSQNPNWLTWELCRSKGCKTQLLLALRGCKISQDTGGQTALLLVHS